MVGLVLFAVVLEQAGIGPSMVLGVGTDIDDAAGLEDLVEWLDELLRQTT
jgi:hypothetical protein